MREELRDMIKEVNELIAGKTMEVCGKTFTFEPILTCDLKVT
jgi:hypothetical protein